jgi:3-hydroxyacyl-CoA dehydrogenase
MKEKIRRVSVVGAGMMGTQIALLIAKHGYAVSVFGRSPDRFHLHRRNFFRSLQQTMKTRSPSLRSWEKGLKRIKLGSELEGALRDADLVVEALPENLALKREIFARLDAVAPPGAILSSTSSSIPISKIEDATKRPEFCLNLHFYQPASATHMVDIMGGSKTLPRVLRAAERFIASLGCIPLVVRKEVLGFCFGGVLRAIYRHVLKMWAGGFVDFRDIDRAWMLFTKMGRGPFGIIDAVGLDVVYDTAMIYYDESKDPQEHPPQAMLDMIRRNRLGVKTGKGFYTYPHPEYRNRNFLTRNIAAKKGK